MATHSGHMVDKLPFLILTTASLMIYSEQKHTVFFTGTFGYSSAKWQSSGRPRWLLVKNLPANAGDARDAGSTPGLGRSPGEGNGTPLKDSCLENSMDRGAWWAIAHGVAKSRIQLSDWAHTQCGGINTGLGAETFQLTLDCLLTDFITSRVSSSLFCRMKGWYNQCLWSYPFYP